MNLKHLQSWAIRVVVAQVYGIAMPEACTVKQASIVVEGRRSPHDFVMPVTVHIGYRHVVVAVAEHSAAATGALTALSRIGGLTAGERLSGAIAVGIIGGQGVTGLRTMAAEPFLVQLTTVETYSPDKGKGVVASYEDAAGGLVWSVEMGHTCQEPLAAIAIAGIVAPAAAVVPVERACGLTAIARVPVRIIEYGMHGLASAAIKHGEPFLSADNSSVAIPIEGRATDALDDIVSSGFVYIAVLAVFRTWARLAHQFCPSITIEVVYHILCVVGTRTDVAPQVDAPKQLSAQLVAIDEHIVGNSAL